MTITVTVNGDDRSLPQGATIATLVESFAAARQGRGLAVAVGGVVVPRGEWAQTELVDGARVEVLVAVQGG